nr:nanos homolog 2-like [Vicugna pacos]
MELPPFDMWKDYFNLSQVVSALIQNYVCPLCGATGDQAHTLKYCSLNGGYQSLYRRSGRNSAGRKVKR